MWKRVKVKGMKGSGSTPSHLHQHFGQHFDQCVDPKRLDGPSAHSLIASFDSPVQPQFSSAFTHHSIVVHPQFNRRTGTSTVHPGRLGCECTNYPRESQVFIHIRNLPGTD